MDGLVSRRNSSFCTIRWDLQRSRALKEHQDLLQKYLMKGGGGGALVKEKKKEKLTTFAPKLEQCQLYIYILKLPSCHLIYNCSNLSGGH